MRIASYLLLIAIIGMAAVTLYVRSVSSSPDEWHVDPFQAVRSGTPNDFLLLPPGAEGADATSPVFSVPPDVLAARLSALISGAPRVEVIGGRLQEGFVTVVARSRWVGWPDYVSLRIVPAGEGGSALAIWSRARFGHSDLGVNEARVREWVSALQR
jgi:uncharacterized protein (DUF1499 family)